MFHLHIRPYVLRVQTLECILIFSRFVLLKRKLIFHERETFLVQRPRWKGDLLFKEFFSSIFLY